MLFLTSNLKSQTVFRGDHPWYPSRHLQKQNPLGVCPGCIGQRDFIGGEESTCSYHVHHRSKISIDMFRYPRKGCPNSMVKNWQVVFFGYKTCEMLSDALRSMRVLWGFRCSFISSETQNRARPFWDGLGTAGHGWADGSYILCCQVLPKKAKHVQLPVIRPEVSPIRGSTATGPCGHWNH